MTQEDIFRIVGKPITMATLEGREEGGEAKNAKEWAKKNTLGLQ